MSALGKAGMRLAGLPFDFGVGSVIYFGRLKAGLARVCEAVPEGSRFNLRMIRPIEN